MDAGLEHKSHLFGIAYRMLGSVADAEDAVQETFLRWHRACTAGETLMSPKAWLSAVVIRICIDQLRSAHAKRETYVGPWLPEPLVAVADPDPGPADRAALADSLSTAFLIVLETLNPKERAVFLLHDVFAYDYAEIAAVVGESPTYCRQLAHRARAHVAARRPRFPTTADEQERLADRFLRACLDGDMSALVATLAEDVIIWSDGGGNVPAARKPVIGRQKAATFLIGLIKLMPAGTEVQRALVNGQPGLILSVDGRPFDVVSFDFDGGAIRAIYAVVNPDKLGGVGAEPSAHAGR